MDNRKELITRYLNGNISKAELLQVLGSLQDIDTFDAWESEWEQALHEDADFIQRTTDLEEKRPQAEVSLFNRISYSIDVRDDQTHGGSFKNVVNLYNWKLYAAAAIVLFVSLGTFFYYRINSDQALSTSPELVSAEETIKNNVLLKREDGSFVALDSSQAQISISDKSVTYQNGDKVVDLNIEKNEMLTIQTPRGATYAVSLSDGTKVWLNSSSSLRYSSNLLNSDQQRVVYLDGEAYFEVNKNEKHPFIVKSRKQDVTVLGTHFNINAYADEEEVKTTLLEGRVKVALPESEASAVYLNPNQQAILSAEEFKITTVDTDIALDWKSGQFHFDREKLPVIMRKIARWYDVDIAYDPAYSRNNFSGIVAREKTLKEVLTMLELTGLVHFKIEGRRVLVMP